jgi:predicted TIM-barrel fold metal-dependent hydrolase
VEERSPTGAAAGDRYVVISADCHAGGTMDQYREYLDPDLREDYDAWRAMFTVPFPDLVDPTTENYRRNHDSAMRARELEAGGIVGEVLFPNTIPPFFSNLAFLQGAPDDREGLRHTWGGLRAHNRWLADFCSELAGRRAGVAQVWLDDLDVAIAEVRRTKEAGIFGGVLLPIPAINGRQPPLQSAYYEPFWAACQDLDVPITVHGGSGQANEFDDRCIGTMILATAAWYTWRPLTQLIVAGVFERYPRLRFAITEAGHTWVPQTLANLDWLYEKTLRDPRSSEGQVCRRDFEQLSMKPSGYWARNVWFGASFIGPPDVELRYETGVDRIMWGSDYPHHEGTDPHTREALRWTFQGVDPDEVQQMVGRNAARMYGFDIDALVPVAADVGPTIAELAGPMDASEIPPDTTCETFETVRRPAGRFF